MGQRMANPTMRQKIFSMDLDVETVSLYLLCCAVVDAGAVLTRTTLEGKWNGSRDALEQELCRLADRNILRRETAETRADPLYRMVDEKQWR